jgi:hypothetical protein
MLSLLRPASSEVDGLYDVDELREARRLYSKPFRHRFYVNTEALPITQIPFRGQHVVEPG